jgi:hypothetical protein
MKLYRIFKLQIFFHTLDIFTIRVLSEIDKDWRHRFLKATMEEPYVVLWL